MSQPADDNPYSSPRAAEVQLTREVKSRHTSSATQKVVAVGSVGWFVFVTLLLPMGTTLNRLEPLWGLSLVLVTALGMLFIRKRGLLCLMIPFWLWAIYVFVFSLGTA